MHRTQGSAASTVLSWRKKIVDLIHKIDPAPIILRFYEKQGSADVIDLRRVFECLRTGKRKHRNQPHPFLLANPADQIFTGDAGKVDVYRHEFGPCAAG